MVVNVDDLEPALPLTFVTSPVQHRKGVSCLHTSFVFQEAVASLRDKKKKAFVEAYEPTRLSIAWRSV